MAKAVKVIKNMQKVFISYVNIEAIQFIDESGQRLFYPLISYFTDDSDDPFIFQTEGHQYFENAIQLAKDITLSLISLYENVNDEIVCRMIDPEENTTISLEQEVSAHFAMRELEQIKRRNINHIH